MVFNCQRCTQRQADKWKKARPYRADLKQILFKQGIVNVKKKKRIKNDDERLAYMPSLGMLSNEATLLLLLIISQGF